MLYVINFATVAVFVLGYQIAFRQRLVRAWAARLRRSDGQSSTEAGAQGVDPEGVASVLRIAGVMIMAFSFTIGAFANLIAYYTSVSPGRV